MRIFKNAILFLFAFLFLTGCSGRRPAADITVVDRNLGAELAAMEKRNPETADFVRNYPGRVQSSDSILLERGEGIPLLMQWDERWGYAPYGSGILGLNGCGPTCLSMVVIGLTGDTSMNPQKIAEFSEENGYYEKGIGSKWTLMSEGALRLGLEAEELPLHEPKIRKCLEQDEPVICVLGPGDFTETGHFIVLTESANGKFRVNDPNSMKNSKKLWSYEELSGQIRNLWAFRRGSQEER